MLYYFKLDHPLTTITRRGIMKGDAILSPTLWSVKRQLGNRGLQIKLPAPDATKSA